MINVMPGSNPYQQYKTNAVQTASPEKLLLMLFDGAIKFANLGKSAIQANDYEAANNNFLKLQDIFDELIYSLDMDKGGEVANNLYKLYDFYRSELIQANIKKDSKRLEAILEFLHEYRSIWTEATKLARQGA